MPDLQQRARFMGEALRSLRAPNSDDPWRQGIDPFEVVEDRSLEWVPDHQRVCCEKYTQHFTQGGIGPVVGGNLHREGIVELPGGYSICIGWVSTFTRGARR